jgi:hypothetical protein
MAEVAQKQRKNSQRKGRGLGRPFQKGQSGNPGGRPKGRTISKALRDLLDKAKLEGHSVPKGQHVVDLVARIVLQGALAGDIRFLELLADRTEGKPVPPIEHDGQLVIRVIYDDTDPTHGEDGSPLPRSDDDGRRRLGGRCG